MFQTDRLTDRQTERQTEKQRERQREPERQRAREPESQRDRETETETERKREVVVIICYTSVIEPRYCERKNLSAHQKGKMVNFYKFYFSNK